MHNPLDAFLESARTIALHTAEKDQILKNVQSFVRKGAGRRLHSRMDDNILSTAKIVGLSALEKSELKGKLFQTMEADNPLSTTLANLSRSAQKIRLSPAEHVNLKEGLFAEMKRRDTFFYRMNPFRLMTGVVASIFLITLTGTGITYAAESALPGESLYFVKLNVNEAVWSRLSDDTAETRARFAIGLAERRLTEAVELAARKRFAADTRQIIEVYFIEHVDASLAYVDDLFRAGNLKAAGTVALEVEAIMQAHIDLLASQEDNAAEITLLLTRVHQARRSAEKITIIANLGSQDFLTVAGEAASEAIARAEKEMKRRSQTDVRYMGASSKLSNAKKDLDNEQTLSEAEKLHSVRSALRKAKEATLILRSKKTPTRIVPSSSTIVIPVDDQADALDMRFTTSVQLEMANEELDALEKKLFEQKSKQQDLNESTIDEPEKDPDPLHMRLQNSRFLLQEAALDADTGDDRAALEKSEQALREAEAVKNEWKELPSDLQPVLQ